jgi:hypothetical protein
MRLAAGAENVKVIIFRSVLGSRYLGWFALGIFYAGGDKADEECASLVCRSVLAGPTL